MIRLSRDISSLIKGAVFLTSLALIGWLVQDTELYSLLSTNWIDQQIKGQGINGEILFVLVAGSCAAIGLPRQIVSFMGGYAFGLGPGLALALLATVFGCICTFFYARLLGQKLVLSRAPRRIKKIDAFLQRAPFTMTLVIRLLPAGNNALTCLAAGVSSISAVRFISGSALGYIPQTAVFVLVGSGSSISSEIQILVSALLFLVSAGVGLMLYRKYGKDVSVPEQGEDEPGPDKVQG